MITLLVFFTALYVISSLLWRFTIGGRNHRWVYRNPASRRCLLCKRHENLYVNAGRPDTWEEMYPFVDGSAERCHGS